MKKYYKIGPGIGPNPYGKTIVQCGALEWHFLKLSAPLRKWFEYRRLMAWARKYLNGQEN